MLFTTDGTPLKEALQAAALHRTTTPIGRQKPTPYLPDQHTVDGRAQRTLRNRLGDVYRVFRSLAVGGVHPNHVTPRYSPWAMPQITERCGVGRPPGTPLKPCRVFVAVPTLNERRRQRYTGKADYEMVVLSPGLFAGLSAVEPYAEAVKVHGSQRKAAAALGISLGKLQRGLRKEQA